MHDQSFNTTIAAVTAEAKRSRSIFKKRAGDLPEDVTLTSMPSLRFLRFPALLIVVIALLAWLGRGEKFTIRKGLKFSEVAPALTLDLYLPTAIDQPVPCVMVVQGGGFLPQGGRRFKPFAEYLASNGFAAALISYRGRPDHQYRDTLEDVRASVRYIRASAGDHQIDPNRIGAMGRSAGGTLTALLAVHGDRADPASRIQAAVCFAGVFDFVSRFHDADQLALQSEAQVKLETNGQWIGTPFSTTDKHWLDVSAINHVDPGDPPILFLHSRNDATVPWLQSRDMHRAMTEAGIAAEIKIFNTGGHQVRPHGEVPMDEMVAFFRKHL